MFGNTHMYADIQKNGRDGQQAILLAAGKSMHLPMELLCEKGIA